MAERLFDIHLELDPIRLAGQTDPTRTIAEISRQAADDHCAANRALLLDAEPREVVVKEALSPLTGERVLLVATRWAASG